VKELQSIVDYTRAPETTQSAAINPLFTCTTFTNEAGQADYPCYWSATTHGGFMGGGAAMYVAFGRAAGWMSSRSLAGGPPGAGRQGAEAGEYRYVDVHGAGSQRSDPKAGDPAQFPHGRGPQGDVIRIYNHVRLVRGGDSVRRPETVQWVAPPTPAPVREAGAPPGEPGLAGQRTPASPIVTALDLNGDGIIDAGELAKATEALKKLDKNGDGKITPEEYRPQRPGRTGR
jgi:hypothetical protein